jgi:dipeptidyl aminopeptidase/acylaminoacyl peptidase
LAHTDGQARVFAYGGAPLHVVDDRVLTEGSAEVTGASISSDGQWVAYSENRGGDENIYVVPFSGGSPRAVASSPAAEAMPRWSPDGSRLAFTREDSAGRVAIVANNTSGTAQRISSIAGPFANFGPAWVLWGADSRHLSFYARDLRRAVLVDLNRQTEQEIVIPDSIGTGYVAVIPSPDGQGVVASTIDRQTDWGELWGTSLADGQWRKLPGPFGESWPIAFHRDGWIYLQNERGVLTDDGAVRSEIWRVRPPDGRPEFVAPVPDGCTWIDLAADGRRGTCPSLRSRGDLFLASNFDPELHR